MPVAIWQIHTRVHGARRFSKAPTATTIFTPATRGGQQRCRQVPCAFLRHAHHWGNVSSQKKIKIRSTHLHHERQLRGNGDPVFVFLQVVAECALFDKLLRTKAAERSTRGSTKSTTRRVLANNARGATPGCGNRGHGGMGCGNKGHYRGMGSPRTPT